MARAYSTFANGGRRIDGSVFGNHRAVGAEFQQPGREGSMTTTSPSTDLCSTHEQNALLTSILEGVVRSGTGRRAALPDRVVAGKTGTTENYGDAWFVGYTPQLATAVWVGYPDRLKPMLSEYHGRRRRRRNVPRGDLEDVQQACARGDDAAVIPALHIRVRVGEASRVARRSFAARQRPLPRYRAGRRVFLRARATAQRGLQAE